MDLVRELIVDAYECSGDLSDESGLISLAERAVTSVGATVAETASHAFQPHGLTLCLILKESHLVISTWPEYKFATANIFLCNSKMDPKDVWSILSSGLSPKKCVFHEVGHRIHPQMKAA